MNRWPYQSVLCLVFNLDAEGKRSREGVRDEDRERKRASLYSSQWQILNSGSTSKPHCNTNVSVHSLKFPPDVMYRWQYALRNENFTGSGMQGLLQMALISRKYATVRFRLGFSLMLKGEISR